MSDSDAQLHIGRMITGNSLAARIADGVEMRTPENIPPRWQGGDTVVFVLATNDRATFIARPDAGRDVFAYMPNPSTTWHVELERLTADRNGRAGLRVKLGEDHREDEDGR